MQFRSLLYDSEIREFADIFKSWKLACWQKTTFSMSAHHLPATPTFITLLMLDYIEWAWVRICESWGSDKLSFLVSQGSYSWGELSLSLFSLDCFLSPLILLGFTKLPINRDRVLPDPWFPRQIELSDPAPGVIIITYFKLHNKSNIIQQIKGEIKIHGGNKCPDSPCSPEFKNDNVYFKMSLLRFKITQHSKEIAIFSSDSIWATN